VSWWICLSAHLLELPLTSHWGEIAKVLLLPIQHGEMMLIIKASRFARGA
jgi:hypothetical protein